MSDVKCTVPECSVHGCEESMWLPEWEAIRRANGGKKVVSTDLPKFALCGKHGRLLREAGLKVFRFSSCLASARKQEEAQKAERASFAPFAARFLPSNGQGPKGNGGQKPAREVRQDGTRGATGVGQGLSRCSAMDKRRKAKAEPVATN